MTTEEMRTAIRIMIAELDLSMRDISSKIGVNNSMLGYITDTKRVPEIYEKVKDFYDKSKV